MRNLRIITSIPPPTLLHHDVKSRSSEQIPLSSSTCRSARCGHNSPPSIGGAADVLNFGPIFFFPPTQFKSPAIPSVRLSTPHRFKNQGLQGGKRRLPSIPFSLRASFDSGRAGPLILSAVHTVFSFLSHCIEQTSFFNKCSLLLLLVFPSSVSLSLSEGSSRDGAH